MLKGIPEILSPELMKTIMEMGHGGRDLFWRHQLPGAVYGKRQQGDPRGRSHTVTDLIDAVLQFFPLDTFVEKPVAVVDPADMPRPEVWDEIESIIKNRDFCNAYKDFDVVERFAFS